ncbi:MAG: DNA-protecting protein DprA [Clostridiales bacterium]|nr:DNA-protecting protein DprA [Clostridiales bacterium]
MTVEEKAYWLWFAMVKGVSYAEKMDIIRVVKSPSCFFHYSASAISKIFPNNKAVSLLCKSAGQGIAAYLDAAGKYKTVSILEDSYPFMLRETDSPPIVLFYEGNLSVLNKRCIGVVGMRAASKRGMFTAESYAQKLVSSGFTVVTGGARGIDTCAINGALASGGNVCVVLGCGIDKCYPSENKELFEEVKRHGVVISELMPNTPPLKHNFPVRNRIISGLCEGVLVVEAGEKSGALNTATHAATQNRDVYVTLGVGDEYYSGCKKLLDDGAILASSPYDIIDKEGFSAYDGVIIKQKYYVSKASEEAVITEDVNSDAHIKNEVSDINGEREALLAPDRQILEYLSLGTSIHADELMRLTGMVPAQFNSRLAVLEMNGYVEVLPGKLVRLFRG